MNDELTPVAVKKNGRRAKPIGRPSALTDETEAAILAAVRTHQRLPVAASLAGVAYSTVMKWRTQAIEARLFLEGGGRLAALTALDRRSMEFLTALELAEAQAEGRAVRGWLSAGLERQTERTTRQKFAGMDDKGQPIMVTEETVKDIPPNADLLIKWLQARVPAYKATAPPDVSIEVTVRAAALAERVRAAIAVESSEVEE